MCEGKRRRSGVEDGQEIFCVGYSNKASESSKECEMLVVSDIRH